MNDPKVSIMGVISDNWTAANTSTITPVLSTGWYDSKQKLPQITFTDPTEVPQSAGPAPFLGITTNGAPAQLFVGSLMCNIWVTRAGVSINPKKCVFELKQELKRILQAKYGDVTDLNFIGWRGGTEVVEADQVPPVFRFIGEIGYAYLDT